MDLSETQGDRVISSYFREVHIRGCHDSGLQCASQYGAQSNPKTLRAQGSDLGAAIREAHTVLGSEGRPIAP